MICKAKTSAGEPCRKSAITGARVCASHGGSAPQVVNAARQRLLMAADPVAARLIAIARSPKTDAGAAVRAICAVLDRAGVTTAPEAAAGEANGQVLWDEFVAMYRRRAPGVVEEGTP